MVMDSELVRFLLCWTPMFGFAERGAGWYDSVFDPELGSQPCIFTSVTPVGFDLLFPKTSLNVLSTCTGLE
jgi:hypothetical protein